MGAHSSAHASSTAPNSAPLGGRAVAATGLTVLGLLGGTGAALAGEASSPDTADAPQGSADSSECSVGGTPAGGTGTGSPDGVITNGECSDEEIEQAEHDAETDGDPGTRAGSDTDQSDADAAGGNPNVVGGTGDGISSQSGTAQKLDDPGQGTSRQSGTHTDSNPTDGCSSDASSDDCDGEDEQPILAGVL